MSDVEATRGTGGSRSTGTRQLRILVTGSRDWPDRGKVQREIVQAMVDLAPLQEGQMDYNDGNIMIVHGDCPTGADAFADDWAVGSMTPVERHPADWERYGKAAGFKRNSEMVDLGADICLAFSKNNSRGTADTIIKASRAGIPVRVFRAE